MAEGPVPPPPAGIATDARPDASTTAPGSYRRPSGWPDTDLVDCDVHVTVPSIEALLPHLDDRWRDYVVESGTRSLGPEQYPPHAPLSARPGLSPTDGPLLDRLRTELLAPWRTRYAVVDCVYGVDAIHNADWASAMACAVNDWQLAEFLTLEPRLRGSIVVASQDPLSAADEIERLAGRDEFVQVLLPVRSAEPLGRRRYWPIYEAAQRHGLVVGIHAGGVSGSPITPVGWPTYYLEDYVDLALAFQSQVLSLVSEGVFTRFPELGVVLIEGGFTWMPPLMWRFDKNWKGLRREIPWVDRLPSQVIREHIRLTTQPLDEPDDARQLVDVMDQLGSDEMLLFATDYPHWQFDDAEQALPAGLSDRRMRQILGENALRVYRLEGRRQ